MRSLLVACLGLLAGKANAQGPAQFEYLIQFIATIDGGNQKLIQGALHEQDPGIKTSVGNSLLTKARTAVHLDQDQLEATLAPFGLSIDYILMVTVGDLDATKALHVFLDSFPHYVNTGDPSLDLASYQAAKADWIAAHPGHFQQLLYAGVPSGSDPSK